MPTDISNRDLPRYIAVEGPIGVGKTSLAKKLASTFGYDTLLEAAEENPFLERFYRNRREAALPTQLFFLFPRMRQIQALRQEDMFKPIRVADFLIEKDRLFARSNLDDDELHLYQTVYEQMTIDAPVPDLVIYLQAPVDVLLSRIKQRGIAEEQLIEEDYLRQLNDAYTQFFHYYDSAPLLIVNAATIDPINNEIDFNDLLQHILTIQPGRHYYNPPPRR